jgi:selenide,water dikinase
MTTLNKTAAEVISRIEGGTGVPARPAEQSSAATDQRPSLARPELSEGTNDALLIHALTDVTGFGLMGHLREMLLASENVSATLYSGRVPLLEGALECVRDGHIPGGLKANRDFAECVVQYEGEIPEELKTLLFDPQTAGGLLISVGATAAAELTRALNQNGVPALEIGEVLPLSGRLIQVAR